MTVHAYKLCTLGLVSRNTSRPLIQNVRHEHSSVAPELRQMLRYSIKDPVGSKRETREYAATVKLSKMSKKDLLLLRRLKFEYEIEKAESDVQMPKHVPNWYWLQLLKEKSFEGRMLLYEELYDYEAEQEDKINRQYQEYQKYEKLLKALHTTGGLRDTYVYVGDKEMYERRRTSKLNNSLNAWRFGRPIVFEYSPNSRYLTEILHCLQLNQDHRSPLAFHITNMTTVNGSSEMENISQQNPFLEFHAKGTHHTFAKERLVYICENSESSFNLEDNSEDIPVFTEHHSAKHHKFGNVRTARIPASRYIKLYDPRDIYVQYMLTYKFGSLLDYYMSENWTSSFINNLPAGIEAYTVDELLDYIHQHKKEQLIKYTR